MTYVGKCECIHHSATHNGEVCHTRRHSQRIPDGIGVEVLLQLCGSWVAIVVGLARCGDCADQKGLYRARWRIKLTVHDITAASTRLAGIQSGDASSADVGSDFAHSWIRMVVAYLREINAAGHICSHNVAAGGVEYRSGDTRVRGTECFPWLGQS